MIINQGMAGANDPELKVFDIVVGEATVDFGAFRSSHADAGQGIDMSRWTPMSHRLRIDGKERKSYPRFEGDGEAMAVALETPYKRGRVTKGVIGSAFE
jgi:adenosylhomocysteine nucleosidase